MWFFLECGLTDAEYEKQYWLNIPESEVEDPNEVLFDPELLNPNINPKNPLNQPIRPPRRKRGIHHTLPERRQVHTEEVKTYPDDIVADEQNTMTSMQGLHDQTLERILIRPHIAAHYQHLISNSYYCHQTWFLLKMTQINFVSRNQLQNTANSCQHLNFGLSWPG